LGLIVLRLSVRYELEIRVGNEQKLNAIASEWLLKYESGEMFDL